MTETPPTQLTVFQHAIGIMSRWPGPVRVTQHAITLQDRHLGLPQIRLVDTLHWTGKLTPTAVSPTYTVEFTFTDGDYTVDAQVLNPALDPGVSDELPHIYTDTHGLCLHEPGQWDQSFPIGTTIIPWAAEWLLHYELWKATGVWTGGGATHARPVRPADGRKRQGVLTST